MASIIDIADAIVTVLNGGSFSLAFTATRSYRPTTDVKDLTDLTVTVIPRGREYTTIARRVHQDELQIDIGFQQKLLPEDDDSILDALLALTEEVAVFVRDTHTFGTAKWVSTTHAPIYSANHLSEFRQFTSVLTLALRDVGP